MTKIHLMNVYESKDIEGWGQVCGAGRPASAGRQGSAGPEMLLSSALWRSLPRQDMARSKKILVQHTDVTTSHRNLESSIDVFDTHNIRELLLKETGAAHLLRVVCYEGSNDVASAPNTRTNIGKDAKMHSTNPCQRDASCRPADL